MLPMAFALSSLLKSLFGGPLWGAPKAEWRAGAGDVVLRLDSGGTILAASPTAEAVLAPGNEVEDRFSCKPLTGRSILDFVSREDREAVNSGLVRAGGASPDSATERVECRLRGPGVAEIVFAEMALVRAGDGVSVLIRERGAELSALRRERAAHERAQSQQPESQNKPHPAAASDGAALLADVSHDLKTPLNAIIGFAGAMREETFGPLGHEKYREYADLIHASGLHLGDLIASILDRARLDAGQSPLSPALCAPAAIARHCADMVRGQVERAGLTFRVDIADDLPDAMIDATAVKRILTNLLSNAIKFTAEGEVALAVTAHNGEIAFAVSDTGVGMSQVALARMGERFTDLHKTGVRGAAGTGLGLSLAFALAKLHGGALSFTSARGEGTVATLALPVRKSLAEFEHAERDSGLIAVSDIHSQLDRVAQFRREHQGSRNGRDAA